MRDCQFASPDNEMLIPFFTQWRITGPPIRAHATAKRNMALNKAAETLCRGIRHTLEANPADTPSCLASIPFIFNTDNNQSFTLGSSLLTGRRPCTRPIWTESRQGINRTILRRRPHGKAVNPID